MGNSDCHTVAGVYCSAVKEDFQEVPENIYDLEVAPKTQDVPDKDLFNTLMREQERRRKRLESWSSQKPKCDLPQRVLNPFTLSLLEEAYIYSSQVRVVETCS